MSRAVQQVPHTGPRVETGAVVFGYDWPGLFVRGDDAFGLRGAIRNLERLTAAMSPEVQGCVLWLSRYADLIEREVIVMWKGQPSGSA